MKKSIYIALIAALFLIVGLNDSLSSQDASKITGTWVAEGDISAERWVFGSNIKCLWYSNNELVYTFTYSFSSSSPQCGETVHSGPKELYLQLANDSDSNDKYCYEVTTLNDQYLGLRLIGSPGYKQVIYVRQ